MPDDTKAKLQSLKTLRGQMKDWKKDDLRKKKGIPDKKEQKDQKDQEKQEQSEGEGQPESMLARLIQKLVK